MDLANNVIYKYNTYELNNFFFFKCNQVHFEDTTYPSLGRCLSVIYLSLVCRWYLSFLFFSFIFWSLMISQFYASYILPSKLCLHTLHFNYSTASYIPPFKSISPSLYLFESSPLHFILFFFHSLFVTSLNQAWKTCLQSKQTKNKIILVSFLLCWLWKNTQSRL